MTAFVVILSVLILALSVRAVLSYWARCRNNLLADQLADQLGQMQLNGTVYRHGWLKDGRKLVPWYRSYIPTKYADIVVITDRLLCLLLVQDLKGEIIGRPTDKAWGVIRGSFMYSMQNPVFKNEYLRFFFHVKAPMKLQARQVEVMTVLGPQADIQNYCRTWDSKGICSIDNAAFVVQRLYDSASVQISQDILQFFHDFCAKNGVSGKEAAW